ncbi:aldehyde ferredoxin oxidoreductase family protein [Chloroflexota bacterium]
MARGYMGKVLFVNLDKGELKDEALDEKLCREFVGGYGIGARIIYSRQKAGVDPLGPDNILGFMTGPLTGTATPFGSRYVVIGKSPLTGTWGDANSGGDFGPYLKFAGYDGVFFTGASKKPVYLFIEDGKAELRDAAHLWGKDVDDTEDILNAELGKEARIASIGPSGEKLSLIACVMNNKGRAAGRSGVGAIMGSKKVKAIAVIGTAKVPVANREELNNLRKKYVAEMDKENAKYFRTGGTCWDTVPSSESGDSPVKNWSGVGIKDFPNASQISGEEVMERTEKKFGCYRCPVSCGGTTKAGTEYKYKAGAHKPEYETLSMFGSNCLNDNVESIIMAGDICNRYGLDTISAGGTIAFAIECYENGLITKEDTEGIELTWGNHKAIVDMTEKLAKREGFGAVLADGVKVAAEKIGKGAEKYAMHVHGEELPAHDARLNPVYTTSYQYDPTPARHTQSLHGYSQAGDLAPIGTDLTLTDKYTYTGKGQVEVMFKNKMHLLNAAGVCQFSVFCVPWDAVDKLLSVVTGWQLPPKEINMTCERISTMRQAFNLREGLSPKDFKLPERTRGNPPLKEGPNANITVDVKTLIKEYYEALDWDPETGKPSKKKLLELGLDDIAKDLWP